MGVLGNNARNGGTPWVTTGINSFFRTLLVVRSKWPSPALRKLTQPWESSLHLSLSKTSSDLSWWELMWSDWPQVMFWPLMTWEVKTCGMTSHATWDYIKSHQITISWGLWNQMRSEDHKVTWEFCLFIDFIVSVHLSVFAVCTFQVADYSKKVVWVSKWDLSCTR